MAARIRLGGYRAAGRNAKLLSGSAPSGRAPSGRYSAIALGGIEPLVARKGVRAAAGEVLRNETLEEPWQPVLMADADDSAADGDAAPSGVTRVRSGAVRRASAGERRVLAMPRMPSACSNACASTGKADANERGCHDYSMLCLACRVPCCMLCCTPPTGPCRHRAAPAGREALVVVPHTHGAELADLNLHEQVERVRLRRLEPVGVT